MPVIVCCVHVQSDGHMVNNLSADIGILLTEDVLGLFQLMLCRVLDILEIVHQLKLLS